MQRKHRQGVAGHAGDQRQRVRPRPGLQQGDDGLGGQNAAGLARLRREQMHDERPVVQHRVGVQAVVVHQVQDLAILFFGEQLVDFFQRVQFAHSGLKLLARDRLGAVKPQAFCLGAVVPFAAQQLGTSLHQPGWPAFRGQQVPWPEDSQLGTQLRGARKLKRDP